MGMRRGCIRVVLFISGTEWADRQVGIDNIAGWGQAVSRSSRTALARGRLTERALRTVPFWENDKDNCCKYFRHTDLDMKRLPANVGPPWPAQQFENILPNNNNNIVK